MPTRLQRPEFRLLYPFSVLCLLPSWLVETRYYFVPYSLFVLFRSEASPRVERTLLAWWLLLSAAMLYGARRNLFFW